MKIQRRTVEACVQLSKESYAAGGDDDQGWAKHAESRLLAKGYSEIRTWVSSDAELLAATVDGCRIYAWRGSHAAADWIANINTKQIPFYKSGKIHNGFSYRFRSILNQEEGFHSLGTDIQSHRTRGRPIICTGHSLGGATATAMAAHELSHGRGVHGLVTFGAPRVGSGEFAVALEAGIRMSSGEILRFVHRCDPVPMLPTLWKYRHAGSPMFFARDGSLKTRPSFGWMCLDRFLDGMAGRRPLADHGIDSYVERIKDKYR